MGIAQCTPTAAPLSCPEAVACITSQPTGAPVTRDELVLGGDGEFHSLETKLDVTRLYGTAPSGTDTRGVEFTFSETTGGLRVGGSDPTSLDDQKNFWRGLSAGQNTNAWGSLADQGLYSVAFGRNGASKGVYSATFGHDCVAYGVASIAGGAGSATGNPDAPTNPDNEGYCSIAWGKGTIALGAKSAAFGEENEGLARAGLVAGYQSKTGSVGTDGGVGATALGRTVLAYGTGAFGGGKYLHVTNGGAALGSGINPGNPMVVSDEVGIGANVALPTAYAKQGTGAVNNYGVFGVRAEKQEYLGGTTLVVAETTQALVNGGAGGYGEYHIRPRVAGAIVDGWKVEGVASAGIVSLIPAVDAAMRLGAPSNRIDYAFFVNAPIVTSDEREKESVGDITDTVLAAWSKINYQQYKLKNQVSSEGDSAVTHFGVIAQQVISVFKEHGVDALQLGLVQLNKWVDADGKACEMYGVNYTQAMVLECALLRKRLDTLDVK